MNGECDDFDDEEVLDDSRNIDSTDGHRADMHL